MSEKRPILEVRNKFGELYVARDGITVLTEGDPCDEALIHGVVRAWNAMIIGGVAPAALATSPECVSRLVEAARKARTALTVAHGTFGHEGPLRECGCGVATAVVAIDAALRACGIKVSQ